MNEDPSTPAVANRLIRGAKAVARYIPMLPILILFGIPSFGFMLLYLLLVRLRLVFEHRRFTRRLRSARSGGLPAAWRKPDTLNFSITTGWRGQVCPEFDPYVGPDRKDLFLLLLFLSDLYPKLSMIYRDPLHANLFEPLVGMLRCQRFSAGERWLRRLSREFAWLARHRVGSEQQVQHWRYQRKCAQSLLQYLQRPPKDYAS